MADYYGAFGDRGGFALGLAGWLTLNSVGLILVLIARSPWHWFLRSLLALGVVSSFTLLPGMEQSQAYDLVLVVFVQACVVLAPWLLFARDSSSRISWRFSLSSLLLFMPLVAIAAALASRVPRLIWGWSLGLLLIGAIAGLSTLSAAVVGLGLGRWWARLLAFVPALPSFGVFISLWLWRRASSGVPARSRWDAAGRWFAGGTALAVASLILVFFLSVFWCLATAQRLTPQPPLPFNGLDMIAQVGDQLPQRAPDVSVRVGTPWATNQALDQFMQQYAGEFAAARAALNKECRALPDDLAGTNMYRYAKYRNLGRGFQAASIAAARNGRPDEAVEYGLECYRLGRAVGIDGILIDVLVGRAVEGLGFDQLARVRHYLDRAAALQLSAQLLEFDRAREAPEIVLAREDAWQTTWLGWFGELQVLAGENHRAQETFVQLEQRSSAMLRLLATDLAVRAYFMDRGHLPETLEALVPEYLPAVPLDPFGEGPLRYRIEQRSWHARMLADRFERSQGTASTWLRQFGAIGQPPPFVVYSVGLNETDEGGVSDPERPWGWDYDFVCPPSMNWAYESLRPYFDLDGV